jgi:hypothetical protein
MIQIGWTLDFSMWEQLPEALVSRDWRRVKFTYESSDLVDSGRGVYLIILDAGLMIKREPFCGLRTPVYVGISTNLRKRFKEHARPNIENSLRKKISKFRDNASFWFQTYNEDSKDELRIKEQALIDVFGGPLNKINSVAKQPPISGKIKI